MRQKQVDWVRQEIGRIRVAYGTTVRERAAFVHVLDELYERNALDTLRAIKSGQLTARQLMAERRAGRHLELDVVLNATLAMPLWSTLDTMVNGRHAGEKHKTRLRTSIAKWRASKLLPDTAQVRDLRKLRRSSARPIFASAADWNHARRAILTPLSALLGEADHPFRREIRRLLGPAEAEPMRPLDITRAQFWALVDALPERPDARAGKASRYNPRNAVVALAATGMRLNTEWYRAGVADLRPAVPGVYCRGSKTADSLGIVHVAPTLYGAVEDAITNRCPVMTLRRHFVRARKQVGLDDLTLHDLRHLTAIFAFEGGAQLNEVQAMLRHADPTMTSRYAAIKDRGRAAEAIGRALERPIERAD